MSTSGTMPGACLLCGSTDGVRRADGWHCRVCDWRVGDVPDTELPRPRVDVVYYIRWNERVKIGTTGNPKGRLSALWHHDLLAFERGGRKLERARHIQFADLREGGEWFTAHPRLLEHAADIAHGVDPWHTYARWVSEALCQ
ncbi:GIY-YIG nuclease family protein [Paramicrobacterium fandaimingii]|uniref:GIY-YIG nuclease family protein n=2 Tax=Paramicrobacterium fandaimingii TaxID=2708079 RepID=UPI001FD354F9|nr:GIY-YIG nuclease family protein [Microbacterium fandaimingii]